MTTLMIMDLFYISASANIMEFCLLVFQVTQDMISVLIQKIRIVSSSMLSCFSYACIKILCKDLYQS